jgi:hypothetical protein
MPDRSTPRAEGVTVSSDLTPVPNILLKKTHPKNNIVVGDDEPQIRFLEQQLGSRTAPRKRIDVQRVTDDMLLGNDEGKLYHVFMKHRIDLSDLVRKDTGIWSAEPIVKGSAAINTIVRHAATLLPDVKTPLKREVLDRIGDELTREKISDIRGLIWQAVWMLSGDNPPKSLWKDPWDSPFDWLTPGINPEVRLHVLYKKLVGYASLIAHNEAAATKFGIKPSQQQHLKNLTLDTAKVYRTISLLSRWRQDKSSPYICATQVAAIWW